MPLDIGRGLQRRSKNLKDEGKGSRCIEMHQRRLTKSDDATLSGERKIKESGNLETPSIGGNCTGGKLA